MTTAEAVAPAKLNLALDVGERRADGFHSLASVIVAIDIFDRVTVEEAPQASIAVIDHTASGEDLGGRENLALRAAQSMEWKFWTRPVAVRLEKEIPVSAGLGGGSSDAAAAIRAVDELFEIGLNREEQGRVALELGSDAPFFAFGGAAFVQGRGEIIRPLADTDLVGVLVLPQHNVARKTPTMFRLLDERPRAVLDNAERLAARWPELDDDLLRNDFELIADEVFPALAEARRALTEAGASGVHLSGAGPALFTLCTGEDEALALQSRLPGELPGRVFRTVPADLCLAVRRG